MSRVQQRSSSPVDVLTDNLAVGAAVGAVMFVVNFVLMYLFVTIDDAMPNEEAWKFVGNVLYNAQFVDSEVSGGGTTISFNYVTGSSDLGSINLAIGDTIPTFIYHLAPIIILVVAGFIVAQQAQTMDVAGAAAAGASIAVGTVVLSLVGTFLFEFSEGGASAGPGLVMSLLLVGIIIPAVAGAIGGAIADQV